MKLPHLVSQFLQKKSETKDLFLSLILDVASVQGAVWSLEDKKKPKVQLLMRGIVKEDTWDERIQACDEVLGKLEEQLPDKIHLTNVVLGLPSVFVTKDGDIHTHIRTEIKKLTKELELHPIGFVPIPHALIHKFKVEEGVPPSVILLGLSGDVLSLDLYKVGILIGQKALNLFEKDVVHELEDALKSFRDLEVLPSRILLYGDDQDELECIRQKLLKHPWPTRVNFLHFPKIEVFTEDDPVSAVCMAGASEIATQMGEDPMVTDEAEIHTVVETASYAPSVVLPSEVIEEESNVAEVDPETFGFTKTAPKATVGDVEAEKDEETKEIEELAEKDEVELASQKNRFSLILAHMSSSLKNVLIASTPVKKLLLLGIPIVLLLIFMTIYWILPSADVTIVTLPVNLEESSTVMINPTATIADPASKIIPAKKQEQSVSGEKIIPVSGKKQIGDPAKGAVTLYNQTFVPKVLAKGTLIATGSLKFTLDDEIKVASATQSFLGNQGNTTYGTAKASVTSVQIGSQGNISADKLFDVSGYGKNEIIARNNEVFAGGTSTEVTVVSRADYDTLVAALSNELVEKAKIQLSASVSGGEKLIDSTIKISVTEKKFTEELDQQAKDLHGKITITVSGMSYQERDIAAILQHSIDAKIPSGYQVLKDQAIISMGKMTVKKDGTITVLATLKELAFPILDIAKIKIQLAGKSIDQAKELLRQMHGVAGVEFNFHRTFWKNMLPMRSQNIHITKTVQN